jgi:hypothetical protein
MTTAQRYGLTQENKGAADQALDFPKLRLKKGEVARLAVFSLVEDENGKKQLGLPAPEGGYFFGLNKPDDNFGGSYECLASEETKRADEYDPDVCPHCAAFKEGLPEDVMTGRRRRFVMHVIRYRTAPGSSKVVAPLSVEGVAWTFTDRYFNALVDENDKWSKDGTPGLMLHDISLTCENEGFQTFKVSVEPDAVWRSDKDAMRLVVGTYSTSLELAPSLRRKLGQRLEKEQLAAKIDEIKRSWNLDGSGAPTAGPVQVDESLFSDLGLADDLFKTDEASALTEASADEVAAVDEENPIKELIEQEAEAQGVSLDVDAALESAPEAEKKEDDGSFDYDSFFDKA